MGINIAKIEDLTRLISGVSYLPVYKNVRGHGGGCIIVKKTAGGKMTLGLKKDSMKSSVRKNHLGPSLIVAGELNDTCQWPTSKKD